MYKGWEWGSWLRGEGLHNRENSLHGNHKQYGASAAKAQHHGDRERDRVRCSSTAVQIWKLDYLYC